MQPFIEDQFLPLLFKASCQAAVVILLVLAAQWIFGRRMSPRLRYGLWLLVAVRLILPVTISSETSLFNLRHFSMLTNNADADPGATLDAGSDVSGPAPNDTGSNTTGHSLRHNLPFLALAWSAGALVMTVCFAITHYRLCRRIMSSRSLIDIRALNLLEDCKQQMGVHAPVALVETDAVNGPCLFGFLRPRLLLPREFARGFSDSELRHVFLHELGHVQRHDILVGWLMAVLQILHWFNPLVWVAFARMRMDRELACDALALSRADDQDNQPYGRTILKLLENFCDPVKAPSLAGIVEDKKQMKERIAMIANFKKTNHGPALTGVLYIVLGLLTLTDAQPTDTLPASPTDPHAPPAIVSTSPKIGETDVDPSLTEITVTFDRDMGRGMSWTGGGPDFPSVPGGAKAKWRDKRTCALPVKLETAHYYRVGINSQSFQNFQSAAGVSAQPSAIFFTTQGASDEMKKRARLPHVVRFIPENGAIGVSPALKELRVTFDVPMGGGMSWCGGGPNFPDVRAGQKAHWTEDGRTCVLPVDLKPGWEYHLGLNSPSFNNFQSNGGVPLVPVDYTFKTGNQ